MNRLNHIDIAKGLLIFLVIIGHTDFGTSLHAVQTFIFWFHMPAFYMISGMFLKEPTFSPLCDCTFLKKQISRYVIPYVSWCVLGYIVFHSEPISKNFVRIAYGGAINTLTYTYPYWFINALFLCIIISTQFIWLNRNKNKYTIAIVAIILFITTHFLPNSIKDLPWACWSVFYFLVILSRWFLFQAMFRKRD